MLEVLAIEQVAGIGKGWYETPAALDDVPADMIDMKVGAKDEVDLLGLNVRPTQFAEVVGGEAIEGANPGRADGRLRSRCRPAR